MRMNLKKILKKSNICIDLKSTDKKSVISEMLDIIISNGIVKDPEGALKALYEREEKMSTGMEMGIAIPHARTDAVSELQIAVGISRKGVDFEALDGEPSRIIIMTLSPTARSGPHIQFIAAISNILSDFNKREGLIKAATVEEALKILI
ncbi:MAG: PTS sugar transporter subunit IIA [Deltaproteobacteria bacterium]|nr:PTS sugar transporter subunit IIA [Deltaproteobacteria bacterium]